MPTLKPKSKRIRDGLKMYKESFNSYFTKRKPKALVDYYEMKNQFPRFYPKIKHI